MQRARMLRRISAAENLCIRARAISVPRRTRLARMIPWLDNRIVRVGPRSDISSVQLGNKQSPAAELELRDDRRATPPAVSPPTLPGRQLTKLADLMDVVPLALLIGV